MSKPSARRQQKTNVRTATYKRKTPAPPPSGRSTEESGLDTSDIVRPATTEAVQASREEPVRKGKQRAAGASSSAIDEPAIPAQHSQDVPAGETPSATQTDEAHRTLDASAHAPSVNFPENLQLVKWMPPALTARETRIHMAADEVEYFADAFWPGSESEVRKDMICTVVVTECEGKEALAVTFHHKRMPDESLVQSVERRCFQSAQAYMSSAGKDESSYRILHQMKTLRSTNCDRWYSELEERDQEAAKRRRDAFEEEQQRAFEGSPQEYAKTQARLDWERDVDAALDTIRGKLRAIFNTTDLIDERCDAFDKLDEIVRLLGHDPVERYPDSATKFVYPDEDIDVDDPEEGVDNGGSEEDYTHEPSSPAESPRGRKRAVREATPSDDDGSYGDDEAPRPSERRPRKRVRRAAPSEPPSPQEEPGPGHEPQARLRAAKVRSTVRERLPAYKAHSGEVPASQGSGEWEQRAGPSALPASRLPADLAAASGRTTHGRKGKARARSAAAAALSSPVVKVEELVDDPFAWGATCVQDRPVPRAGPSHGKRKRADVDDGPNDTVCVAELQQARAVPGTCVNGKGKEKEKAGGNSDDGVDRSAAGRPPKRAAASTHTRARRKPEATVGDVPEAAGVVSPVTKRTRGAQRKANGEGKTKGAVAPRVAPETHASRVRRTTRSPGAVLDGEPERVPKRRRKC